MGYPCDNIKKLESGTPITYWGDLKYGNETGVYNEYMNHGDYRTKCEFVSWNDDEHTATIKIISLDEIVQIKNLPLFHLSWKGQYA